MVCILCIYTSLLRYGGENTVQSINTNRTVNEPRLIWDFWNRADWPQIKSFRLRWKFLQVQIQNFYYTFTWLYIGISFHNLITRVNILKTVLIVLRNLFHILIIGVLVINADVWRSMGILVNGQISLLTNQ